MRTPTLILSTVILLAGARLAIAEDGYGPSTWRAPLVGAPEGGDAAADGVVEEGVAGIEAQRLGVPESAVEGASLGEPEAESGVVGRLGWVFEPMLALAGVLVVVFVLRSLVRRGASLGGGLRSQLGAGGRAPSGLLYVLGRYPIARGQTLVLLKLDRRILLVCQGADGFRMLSEITDEEEVASILVKARDEEGEGLSQRFGQLLKRVERGEGQAERNELEYFESGRSRGDTMAEVKPMHDGVGGQAVDLRSTIERLRRGTLAGSEGGR